jgi:hypothetical protein
MAVRIIACASHSSFESFLCTAHDRIGEIWDHMRPPARYKDFVCYRCVSSAHKYANAVGQAGVIEAIRKISTGSIIGTLYRGAVRALTKAWSS